MHSFKAGVVHRFPCVQKQVGLFEKALAACLKNALFGCVKVVFMFPLLQFCQTKFSWQPQIDVHQTGQTCMSGGFFEQTRFQKPVKKPKNAMHFEVEFLAISAHQVVARQDKGG